MKTLGDLREGVCINRAQISLNSLTIDFDALDKLIETIRDEDFSLKITFGGVEQFFLLIVFSVVNYRFVNIYSTKRPEYTENGHFYRGSEAFYENLKKHLLEKTPTKEAIREFGYKVNEGFFCDSVAKGIDDLEIRVGKIKKICFYISDNWQLFNESYWGADVNKLLAVLINSGMYEDLFYKRLQHLLLNVILNVEIFHSRSDDLKHLSALCDYRLPEYFIDKAVFVAASRDVENLCSEAHILELRAMTYDVVQYIAAALKKIPVEIDGYIWKASRFLNCNKQLIIKTEDF